MKAPRVFFSVGEPSGDLHGSNLIRALRKIHPDVICEGFGGEKMEQAGCRLLYPLSQHPVMGLTQVLVQLRHFITLLNQATQHLRAHRPDALVLVDYPGFNWWMARRAKALGIPVYYFVPPQIWAWASWRIRKMRKYVDHVLTCLPFEQDWYQSRGVHSSYIGHPYFDALDPKRLDPHFLARQRARAGTVIGILPGSRRHEIHNNFLSQMRAAELIGTRRPDCRFLVGCFKEDHALKLARVLREQFPARGRPDEGDLASGYRGEWSLPVELCVGRTQEVIDLAHSCIAVSGSVSLELLHAGKPSVIVYQGSAFIALFFRLMRNVKHVSLVNLLLDRELFPEHVTPFCSAKPMALEILHWLEDQSAYQEARKELARLRGEMGQPGACAHAADYILSTVRANQAA